jgi:cytochrome c oxidase subunit IV
MPDITETTELGDGHYDQPNEAVKVAVDHVEAENQAHMGAGDPTDIREADIHVDHWTDLQFVYLAVALAVVTGIEVALSYMVDDLGAVFLPLLLMLMLIKFFSVVLYFMHLKFDNRWFSILFYMGLFLAVSVYAVALMTFKFFNP